MFQHKTLIISLESVKGQSKLKFYQNLSNFYDEMICWRRSNTFQFEEDPFADKAERISQNYHEV